MSASYSGELYLPLKQDDAGSNPAALTIFGYVLQCQETRLLSEEMRVRVSPCPPGHPFDEDLSMGTLTMQPSSNAEDLRLLSGMM